MKNLMLSDDKRLLDRPRIHQFLTRDSSWARGIDRATVDRSIEHSVCIGAYFGEIQVGFARIITDRATFANLVDVIVWPEFRGQGISRQLMEAVLAHASVKGIRRFTLATSDAHGLYSKFGFTALNKPTTFMERYEPNIYRAAK